MNGKEVFIYSNPEEEKAIGYDMLPEDEEELEKTQEIILDEIKKQMLEKTLIIDKDDLNGK